MSSSSDPLFRYPVIRTSSVEELEHEIVDIYGASSFASLISGSWRLQAETAGTLDIWVDGRAVLHEATLTGHGKTASAVIELSPGPHRVLARFGASGVPLRIRFTFDALTRAEPRSASFVLHQGDTVVVE